MAYLYCFYFFLPNDGVFLEHVLFLKGLLKSGSTSINGKWFFEETTRGRHVAKTIGRHQEYSWKTRNMEKRKKNRRKKWGYRGVVLERRNIEKMRILGWVWWKSEIWEKMIVRCSKKAILREKQTVRVSFFSERWGWESKEKL